MAEFQLFAVTSTGPQPLPVPPDARDFADLYDGLALGVYSAWRTFDHNKFLHLEAHLTRTRRSAALIGWELGWDESQIRRAIHEVCTAAPYPEMRVRLDVLNEPARQLGSESPILLALMPFAPPSAAMYETGVRLDIAPDLSREQPLAKTADFAALRRDYAGDAYEYLLLDETGRILEGMGSNFYAVRDGVVWTAGEEVLGGITRQVILALLPQLGIPLRLEPVHVNDLPYLDEAAMSSSSRALLPVVAVGGQTIGDGRPGPISRRILTAYNDYVAWAVKTAVTV